MHMCNMCQHVRNMCQHVYMCMHVCNMCQHVRNMCQHVYMYMHVRNMCQHVRNMCQHVYMYMHVCNMCQHCVLLQTILDMATSYTIQSKPCLVPCLHCLVKTLESFQVITNRHCPVGRGYGL